MKQLLTVEEVGSRVALAKETQPQWAGIGVGERVEQLQRVRDVFVSNKKRFAQLITEDMGKPISEAEIEMEDGFKCLQWYLDHVEEALRTTRSHHDRNEIHDTDYVPVGVTACIVPWNFPFLNFVWSVLPNLLVGNTVVFKHSEKAPRSARFLQEVMDSVLPAGVFGVLYGDGVVGDRLVRSGVDQICFTGSSTTGYHIQATAVQLSAERRDDVRIHTELGGSAPGIVFDDVDVHSTVRLVYRSRFDNCGQVCDGLKRLIVDQSIFEEVVLELAKVLAGKRVDDPLSHATHIGPLVDEGQLRRLVGQVEDAVSKGAVVHSCATQAVPTNGCFYSPTLLTNVTADMRVWREEVFGPVLPIVSFASTQEAIDLANDTAYGLGGYVYTNSPSRLTAVRKQINTGMVSVNGAPYIRPHVPFTSGGYGISGNGVYNGPDVFKQYCRVQITAYPSIHCDDLGDAKSFSTHEGNGDAKRLPDSAARRKHRARRRLIDSGIWHQHHPRLSSIKAYELPLRVGAAKSEVRTFKISVFAFETDAGREEPYYVASYGDERRFLTNPPLVRLQSICPHGHYFHSAHCDCAIQRDLALEQISTDDVGGVFILGTGEQHAGRGIGQVMIAGLYSYGFQTGRDVVTESFNDLGFHRDERNFEQMLEVVRALGLNTIRLLTNNPDKVNHVAQSGGIDIAEVVTLIGEVKRESLKERILLAQAGHEYNREELADLHQSLIQETGQDPLDGW